MKKAIAIFGVLGVLGCFLPLASGWPSFFDLRHLDAVPVYLVLFGFAVPLLAGLAEKTRAAAIAGAIGFGYVLYRFGFDTVDLLVEGGLGAKLMGVAAVGGFISALLAFGERDRR